MYMRIYTEHSDTLLHVYLDTTVRLNSVGIQIQHVESAN